MLASDCTKHSLPQCVTITFKLSLWKAVIIILRTCPTKIYRLLAVCFLWKFSRGYEARRFCSVNGNGTRHGHSTHLSPSSLFGHCHTALLRSQLNYVTLANKPAASRLMKILQQSAFLWWD